VENVYGEAQEFKKFIDGCHQEGIAVLIDLVYNHAGPSNLMVGLKMSSEEFIFIKIIEPAHLGGIPVLTPAEKK
jgi:hypothetical protein